MGAVLRDPTARLTWARPDFPYYSGIPVHLSDRDWGALLLSLAVGLALLIGLGRFGMPLSVAGILLFMALPLLTLRWVAGGAWRALFRPVGWRQVGQMGAFALLTTLGSVGVALLLTRFVPMSANPLGDHLAGSSGLAALGTMLLMIPQLIGEELITILPFLALLWLCITRLGLPRIVGILIALLVSSLLFGAIHLPTYDWNWAQALIGIGAARILLTLAYVATRNLWVSAGAHILNDWTEFGIGLLSATVAAEG